MNDENLISFIKYGTNEKQTRSKILGGVAGISVLSLIGGFFGFYYTYKTVIYSISICLLSVLLMVIISVMSKKLTFKKHVQCSAIISIFAVILFALVGKIFLDVSLLSMYSIPMSFIPLILGIFSFFISYLLCKSNKYIHKKNKLKYNNLATYSAIGAAFVVLVLKQYYKRIMSVISAEAFLGIIFLLLACVFAVMGFPVILKVYYIKKLEANGISLEK